MARLRGLDVSEYNGTIAWDLVPAEFRLVVVRVSDGMTWKDSLAARNLREAARTGRRVMAYHFFHTADDAKRQAVNLWSAVGQEMPYRVFIDLETIAKTLTPAEAVDMAILEAKEVESFFGVPPGIYTYPNFAKQVLGAALFRATELARCPLWMADYSAGENPPESWSPYIPQPWTTWALAQVSGNNSSHVPGIVGAVDHDIFNGDELELRRFCGLPDDPLEDTLPSIVHPAVDFPPRDAPTEE